MKRRYIAPCIEIASVCGSQDLLNGGGVIAGSNGTGLEDLGAKSRNPFDDDENQEISDEDYGDLW